jgi:hypothetical protein
VSSLGCLCDRCGRAYKTNNWPAASLCNFCDVDNTNQTWSYRSGLVKSAADIMGTA